MENFLLIVISIFQIYLIYLSLKGSDKHNRIIEITGINTFFILFLIYHHINFFCMGYIIFVIFILGLYRKS
ncbi:bacteriocin [Streptococcus dysgalactiae subsp. dysgalactiae]|nr:bacteriocin [Streptococcus dysgalactiae]QFZ09186.1 bacteriocin [Streptococcus dysgalactiae]QGG99680.1 bacteriocin [Streptococcus dysgalactiae subsp. dysgalactiae]TYL02061.1 bacteriocin [Streptococcus dysgalactiae]